MEHASNKEEDRDLRVVSKLAMDTDGHTRLLLENPNGWIGSPRPSPDGKRVAYVYVVTESNVALLEHL